MAALTANKERRTRNTGLIRTGSGVAADSTTFYEGGLLMYNNLGRIAKGADSAAFKIAGVAKKALVTGASNTVRIEFEFGHEEWFPVDGTVVVASIGLDATCLDDQTGSIAATTTNDIRLGKIVELETYKGVAGAWIQVGIFSTAAA